MEVQKPKQTLHGSRPAAVNPKPTEDINLVQKSEAQHIGTQTNEAPEATVDDFGDVETPQKRLTAGHSSLQPTTRLRRTLLRCRLQTA